MAITDYGPETFTSLIFEKDVYYNPYFTITSIVRQPMKKIIVFIFDLALMLGGLSLSLWGLFMWTKIGFRFEPKFSTGNKDGTFFLFSIIIGLGTLMYGYFDLKFRKCRNKKQEYQTLPNQSVPDRR